MDARGLDINDALESDCFNLHVGLSDVKDASHRIRQHKALQVILPVADRSEVRGALRPGAR